VDLVRVEDDDWPVLGRLWQLFSHDLSDFRGNLPSRAGLFWDGQERWRAYVGDADRLGYLVVQDDAAVGFALVRGLTTGPRVLAGFFVVRALRRQGGGSRLVAELVRRHPGTWEVAFQEENPSAAGFWRATWAGLFDEVSEELRPAPGRPDLAPDTWLVGRSA
jgi:predicted acetyltransferase